MTSTEGRTSAWRRRARVRLSVLGAVLLASCQAPDPMPPAPPSDAVLSVALQEGFEDDTVVARLDGAEVFRQDAVTTDVRIGLATSFEVPLGDRPATFEVEVPSRGLAERTTVGADGPLHLGISVVDGAVRVRVSEQPFGYL